MSRQVPSSSIAVTVSSRRTFLPGWMVQQAATQAGVDGLDVDATSALGWKPQTTFDDGIRATVEWYRDNRAWWEPIKSGEYRDYYERQYGERLSNSSPA